MDFLCKFEGNRHAIGLSYFPEPLGVKKDTTWTSWRSR